MSYFRPSNKRPPPPRHAASHRDRQDTGSGEDPAGAKESARDGKSLPHDYVTQSTRALQNTSITVDEGSFTSPTKPASSAEGGQLNDRSLRQSRRQRRHKALTEEDTLKPGSRLGRYTVLELLGAGGMGVVYTAYDPELDRRVAIKVVHSNSRDRDSRDRLWREAQALAQLSHPNVITIHDVGVLDNEVFITMEYVEGTSLKDWLASGPHPWRDVLRVCLAAGRGLEAAHKRGIIHRDFSPSNVIIGTDGRVRVLDFGLAAAFPGGHIVSSIPSDIASSAAHGRVMTRISGNTSAPIAVARALHPPSDDTIIDGPMLFDAPTSEGVDADQRANDGSNDNNADDSADDNALATPPSTGPRDSADRPSVDDDPASEGSLQSRDRDMRLTRTGAVMGTPAYMAPEQHSSLPAGPAADQFAFCVTLYQGLFGVRPFPAKRLDKLRAQKLSGKIDLPQRSRGVPNWLKRALLRGLAPRPDGRWPSMHELLSELGRDRSKQRLRLLLAGMFIVFCVSAVVPLFGSNSEASECISDADNQLHAIWNWEQKQAVKQAFADTSLPYAMDQWAHVRDSIDNYATLWLQSHHDACSAAHDYHTQSIEVFDRRIACLDQRLTQLGTVVADFAQGGEVIVDHAADALSNIRSIAHCSNIEALLAQVPPPEDAQTAARAQEIHKSLAVIAGHLAAGRNEIAHELSRSLMSEADLLGYGPVLAEALYWHGRVELARGMREVAGRRSLEDAYWLAFAHRDDDLAAAAAIALSAIDADWLRTAAASTQRLPPSSERVVEQLEAQARYAAQVAIDHHKALEAYRRALALRRQRGEDGQPAIAHILVDMSLALSGLSRYEEALVYQTEAEGIYHRTLGESHPANLKSLNALGKAQLGLRHYELAFATYRKALHLHKRLRAFTYQGHIDILTDMALVRFYQARYVEADMWFEKAISVSRELHPGWRGATELLATYARVLAALGRLAEALDVAESIWQREQGRIEEHPRAVMANVVYGELLAIKGQFRQACARFNDAMRIMDKYPTYGLELRTDAAVGTGLCNLHRGRYRVAAAEFERALTFLSWYTHSIPRAPARTKFFLAQAVVANDRQRGLDLARQALADCALLPNQALRLSKAIERWIAEVEGGNIARLPGGNARAETQLPIYGLSW